MKSKKLWSLIALVVVFVLLIGGYVYVSNRPQKTDQSNDSQEQKIKVLQCNKDDIKKIIIDNKDGKLEIERKDDKTWAIPGKDIKIDQSKVDDISYSFANLEASTVIENADLSKYGLDKPASTATAVMKDGTEKTVYVGNKLLSGNGYYIRLKDDASAYAVWTNHGVNFSRTLSDIRDTSVKNTVDFDNLDSINLSTSKTGKPIELKANKEAQQVTDNYKMNSVMMTKPYSHSMTVNTEKFGKVVDAIQAVNPTNLIDENATDLDKYGLKTPALRVEAKDTNGNSFVIQVGKDKDSASTYVKIGDSNNIYLIEKSTIDPLYVKPMDLISPFAYIANIDDVERIQITDKVNNKNYNITFARETKKAEKEGQKDETILNAKINDKAINDDAFKKCYQDIIGLMVDSENNKADLKNDAKVSTTFYLNKGDNKEVTVNYVDYNEDFYGVYRDGVCEFLIAKDKVKAMFSSIESTLNK
jgi:hypothetical protein